MVRAWAVGWGRGGAARRADLEDCRVRSTDTPEKGGDNLTCAGLLAIALGAHAINQAEPSTSWVAHYILLKVQKR